MNGWVFWPWESSAPSNTAEEKARVPGPPVAGTCSPSECLEESRAHGKREYFKYGSERWGSLAQDCDVSVLRSVSSCFLGYNWV